MPPRNRTRKRKHDVLEPVVEETVKSKTRRSRTKTKEGRGGEDLDLDEDDSAQLKQKPTGTRRGTRDGSQALSKNRSKSNASSASKLNWEATIFDSDSDPEPSPPPTKDKPVISFNGSEDEVDSAKPLKRQRLMRRTRQRSMLEYTVPVEGKGKQKMNVDTREEDDENSAEYDSASHYTEVHRFGSNSESDSPRKIRFEPSARPRNKSPRHVIHAISDSDSEEDVETLPRTRNESIREDSDEDSSPPRRRRLVRGTRPNSNRTGGELSSEDEQLIEEAKTKDSFESSRFSNGSKKSDFMRNLEKLKSKFFDILTWSNIYSVLGRRKGEESESEDEDVEDDEEEEDASQKVDSSNRATKKSGSRDDIFADAKPTDVYSLDEDSQDEDDDFIVEDEEASIELPPMFNMDTFQDLSHHFKVVCQLFVHLSIKTRGHRTDFMKEALKKRALDNYFSVPINMMRRKLLGLRDSLVASSIWKPDFRKPLETYPSLTIQQLDFAVPHCDACNLGGRVSTLQGLLRGTKYDPATYQNKTKESDLNWNLGRFCAARAQVFHNLTHWEYMLFHKLNLEIEHLRKGIEDHDINSRRSIFIPATKGPPPPDDLDDADGLMEWLDGRGIIEAEWLEIKNMMDRAHKLEAKGKGGEDDLEYS